MLTLLPDLPPAFYLLAAPAVLLTGISKGGLGGALGGLAVPMMSLAIAPAAAAAIMLPILCLTDLAGLRAYWGVWDRSLLRVLLPGGLLGVAAGALSFGRLDEAGVRALVGLIAVVFALYSGARLLR
ncbi:TSUP family transporter, partial [Rugamonas sp. FT82W]